MKDLWDPQDDSWLIKSLSAFWLKKLRGLGIALLRTRHLPGVGSVKSIGQGPVNLGGIQPGFLRSPQLPGPHLRATKTSGRPMQTQTHATSSL